MSEHNTKDENVPTSNDEVEEATGMIADANLEDNDDGDTSDAMEEGEGNIDENPLSTLPPEVLERVETLRGLNDQRSDLMEQYLKDRAELEKKYQNLCQPLYDDRAKVIQGLGGDEGEAAEQEQPTSGSSTSKGIPQFWVCAMGHMDLVAELITEKDVDCLVHLMDVKCIDNADGTGFALEFHFESNDYFHNKILTKQYEVPNLLLADEPILKSVVGCNIEWKKGKSLVQCEIKKKQRAKSGKNAGQVRTVVKKERTDSFFHFFSPPTLPSALDAMEHMDEADADLLEETLGIDYDVAQSFRSHIIPKAVLWYTGEALDAEMGEMLDGDEWPGGDGGGFGGTGSGGPSPFPPGQPGENPPECKQN
mmetsp:Transcript_15263/g.23757  ORF Transcript_15263/g.23757 Transcript_15263/m.23757 type:complete len:365 (-) Transcript_15263:167-1261(-)|eukprot:CAMPEP_0195297296 /NCGR_PEP_ID=MMETSP0707-20130614/21240_1 /TAXON_ID=33640 /ORGANISM="Asterionellopsis glacialis, Strain CCMP134" /LENGTH=364 /DNA_ID=CAMNT_0040359077 /DNA_START=97 /DNA_END=1191 /DNA_ORIENTATION=-